MQTQSNSHFIIFSEYVFILLPFIVLLIVKINESNGAGFFSMADWSFAASILYGQALVKFTAGSVNRKSTQWQRVVFIISLITVLGLVPSLVVLALVLISDCVSAFLQALQMTNFVLSTVVFILLGGAGQKMIDDGNSSDIK
jgi:hypothetical protein